MQATNLTQDAWLEALSKSVFEKQSVAAWRSAANLPKVLAQMGLGKHEMPRTQALQTVSQRLGNTPAANNLSTKLNQMERVTLPSSYRDQASAPTSVYRGHAAPDGTLAGAKYEGVVHATPHPNITPYYAGKFRVPGAGEHSLVSRFPVPATQKYTPDYTLAGRSGDAVVAKGEGATYQQLIERFKADPGKMTGSFMRANDPRRMAYETNVAGVQPDARYLIQPSGTSGYTGISVPYTPANNHLLTEMGRTVKAGAEQELPEALTKGGMAMFLKRAGSEEDIPAGPNAMSKGWQFRYMNKEIEEGNKKWLPRQFVSDATPLYETMANPTKQGLVGALLGAGLGGLGGYLGGPHLGMSPGAGAAAGTGLGALLGGISTYGQRRKKNDEIMDDMRHLQPGATVGDRDKLKHASDSVRDLISVFCKVSADPVLDPKYAIINNKQKRYNYSLDSTSPATSGEEGGDGGGEKAAKWLLPRTSNLAPVGAPVGQALAKATGGKAEPYANKGSTATQLGGETAEKYAQCTPFAKGFFEACDKAGVPHREAVEKVSADAYGSEAVSELRSGLEKMADWRSDVAKKLGEGATWLGKQTGWRPFAATPKPFVPPPAASAAVPTGAASRTYTPRLPDAPSYAPSSVPAGAASRTYTPSLPAPIPPPLTRSPEEVARLAALAPKHPPLPPGWTPPPNYGGGPGMRDLWNQSGGLKGQLALTTGGGLLGGFEGENLPINTGSTTGNVLAGAMAFNPFLNRVMGGRGGGALLNPFMRSTQAGLIGAGGGHTADQLASIAGVDHTNFRRLGGTFGQLGGLAAGGGRTLARMAPLNSPAQRFGQKAYQFGEGLISPVMRPFQYAGRQLGMNQSTAGLGQLSRAGQLGRNTAIVGGGALTVNAGIQGAKNTMSEHMANTANELKNQMVPEITDYMGNQAAQMADMYAQQRGLMNQHGQIDPLLASKQQLSGGVDHLFRSMGMDPSRMSPIQKLMIMGGAGAGGVGALTGNPIMAGAGGLSALAGFLPHLMPGQSQQTYHPEVPYIPGQDGHAQGGGGASWRDEFAHQQQQQTG